MGSNAIRFVVAEYQDDHHYKILYREREPVRLTPSSEMPDQLGEETMDRAVVFFRKCQSFMQAIQVVHYRGVATSAVRESANSQHFLDRVRKESGILLETISTDEEARLMYVAVRQKVDLGNHTWLLFDIGGGSVQLSLINAQQKVWTSSQTIGAVRLWERFPDLPRDYSSLVAYIREELSRMVRGKDLSADSLKGCFVTGGSAEEAIRLVNITCHQNLPYELTREHLQTVREKLISLTIEQRIQQLSMSADRADIMLPAIILVEEFCSLFHFSSLLVPYTSLREGILWEIAEQYRIHCKETG